VRGLILILTILNSDSERQQLSDSAIQRVGNSPSRGVSCESGEEDQSATGLLLRTHSAGPVSQICFYLKVRAGYALKPSMTRLHNEELVN
jgi:hypothetical protein